MSRGKKQVNKRGRQRKIDERKRIEEGKPEMRGVESEWVVVGGGAKEVNVEGGEDSGRGWMNARLYIDFL